MYVKSKRALFIATVVKTHIMTFHIPYLKMFKEMGYETVVAARNDYENPDDCRIPYCDHFFDIPFQREPFHYDNIQTYIESPTARFLRLSTYGWLFFNLYFFFL